MRIFTLLLALTMSLSPAQAGFWDFLKKNKSQQDAEIIPATNYLNEFTHMNKKFASSKNLYRFRADIIIPPTAPDMSVSVHYDELKDLEVKEIIWLSGTEQNEVKAFSTKDRINKELEKLVNSSDPGSAYDRIGSNKHLRSKTFFFYKKYIFPDARPIPHTLKIIYENDAEIQVPVEHLYKSDEVYESRTIKQKPKQRHRRRPSHRQPPVKKTQAPAPIESEPIPNRVAPTNTTNISARNPDLEKKILEDKLLRQQKLYEFEMLEIEEAKRKIQASSAY